MMSKLKKDTADLERQFKAAEKAGDKVQMKNLRRQIKENERLMKLFATETAQAADVLRRLDKATPKELQKTLKTLQGQLQGMQRGTDAWNRQVEAIRRVRNEIERTNASMRESKSWWGKIKDEIFSVQNIIMAASAALVGFIAAGRKAVSEFTKMNETETDTRKFTGLTADGIRELNDTFKAMDTRTARESLNSLAQEAGRLGKNTQDAIMGYVKGADVLNVALSDLGQGATEKVAKLSNIFKIEDQYGTYDAMLKVGSVINVLSQNCTASKPYLVEFANRLAGVGAQAQLSLQNIIGFGAVLDSNAQALEASATAIGQVLTRMYQDPAKYAKVAGMDVKKFTDTLNKDANSALIMFLEHLSKAKDLSVLSPMFKDMGENGARVITALSTLAKHIDEVKEQQLNANRAFDEGTSVLNEYNLFNNTAQASLDKAQKKMKELTIELGEKLYPIMSHIYSSSSLLLRALSHIVTFVVENKTAVASLSLAIAGYAAAVALASVRLKVLSALQAGSNMIMSVGKGITLLASAAYNVMTGNIGRASASMRIFNATMLANPIGLVAAAIGLLIPIIVKLCSHTDTYIDKAKKVIEKNKEISESVMKEQRELGILVGKLKAAEKGSEEYKNMKDQLISQYGKYLSGLIDEKGEIIDLAAAYDTLSRAIDRSNRLRNIKTAQNELEQQYDKDQMDNINGLQKALENYGADPQTVGELVFRVSQAVGAGTPVPADIVKRIEDITNNGTSQYSDSGVKLNSVNRAFAVGPDVPGVVNVTDPVDYLNKITRTKKEYRTSKKVLDNVELGINPTKNIQSNELLKTYNSLISIAEGNRYDYARVPNYYISDDIPTALDGHMAIQNAEMRHKQAAQDRNAGAGYGVLLTEDDAKENTNPLTSKDPNTSFQEYADKYKIEVKVQRDKTSGASSNVALSPAEAKQMAEKIADELRLRGISFGENAKSDDKPEGVVDQYSSSVLADKEAKAKAAEARRAATKEKKEFKEALRQIKGDRDEAETEAKALRMSGDIDYRQFFELMREAEWDAHLATKQLYEKYNLQEDADYKALLEKEIDAEKKYNDERFAINKDATERIAQLKIREAQAAYDAKINPTIVDDLKLKEKILSINYNKLMDLQQMCFTGSKEWEAYERQIQDLLYADMMDKRKLFNQKVKEYQQEFDKLSISEKYKLEREALELLYKQKRISEEDYRRWLDALNKKEQKESSEAKDALPGKSEGIYAKADAAKAKFEAEKSQLDKALADGLIDQEEYSRRLAKIKNDLDESLLAPLKECKSEWVSLTTSMIDAWKDVFDSFKSGGNPFETIQKAIEATAAVMAAVTSQVTEFTKAQTEIQIASVQKRYDREISFAEGNVYLTKKLEKKRQEEIAKIKEEAANKEFTMQVIAAVAQTAANAISAYGAGLQVGGPAGLILAPIAAGLAVAQGVMQIATLKKQKEAAAASGYSDGGFTRPGGKDEPAGIVHAGEWVASQKLVNSPVARPLIDMLEHAQRTNTIASLSMEDVSRSISAPMMLAYSKPEPATPQVQVINAQPEPGNGDLVSSLDRLNRRLDQPFVTLNTVAGDFGSKQAQDKYNRMMRNKSRKSR